MRIGGPYVCNLYLGHKLISTGCVVDNFVYQEQTKLLFFVKHHLIGDYHYFTINFYNVDTDTAFEFLRQFDMVFIKQFITPKELEIYRAFHDKFLSSRLIFNLDDEDFEKI